MHAHRHMESTVAKTRVRQNANFVNRLKLIWVVQSLRKKYFY